MNLWIFSDTHMDHGRFYPDIPANADVAIAAGDIQNDEFLVALARKLPVVFVPGNHEFYGHAYAERLAVLRALPGVTVLDNDSAMGGEWRNPDAPYNARRFRPLVSDPLAIFKRIATDPDYKIDAPEGPLHPDGPLPEPKREEEVV